MTLIADGVLCNLKLLNVRKFSVSHRLLKLFMACYNSIYLSENKSPTFKLNFCARGQSPVTILGNKTK